MVTMWNLRGTECFWAIYSNWVTNWSCISQHPVFISDPKLHLHRIDTEDATAYSVRSSCLHEWHSSREHVLPTITDMIIQTACVPTVRQLLNGYSNLRTEIQLIEHNKDTHLLFTTPTIPPPRRPILQTPLVVPFHGVPCDASDDLCDA